MSDAPQEPQSSLILYQTEDGRTLSTGATIRSYRIVRAEGGMRAGKPQDQTESVTKCNRLKLLAADGNPLLPNLLHCGQ